MTVDVRLFARARDLADTASVQVDLPSGASVADLRRALAATYPALKPILSRCALAVNNEFAADSFILPACAEVALLPPVSGG